MITKEEVLELFDQSMHCSQIVAGEMADGLGYDKAEMVRVAAPFGGGMFRGDTCGAVAGALMAIGMKYGHCEPGDTVQDEICVARTAEFLERFEARFGGIVCRDILGYDMSVEGEFDKAKESGRVAEVCPGFVVGALEILDDMMD